MDNNLYISLAHHLVQWVWNIQAFAPFFLSFLIMIWCLHPSFSTLLFHLYTLCWDSFGSCSSLFKELNEFPLYGLSFQVDSLGSLSDDMLRIVRQHLYDEQDDATSKLADIVTLEPELDFQSRQLSDFAALQVVCVSLSSMVLLSFNNMGRLVSLLCICLSSCWIILHRSSGLL